MTGARSSSATAAQRHAPSPSADCCPKRTRSALSRPSAPASARAVVTRSPPSKPGSLTSTERSAPIASVLRTASAAPGGPSDTTTTSPSPAASRTRSASSTGWRSKSESARSPERSSRPVDGSSLRPVAASGTAFTQTAIFIDRHSTLAARHPERLVASGIRGPGEHEQQIREPVQIDHRERVHGPLAPGREHLALGAPAHRPRHVQARRRLGAARKHEAPQLRQRRVRLVAVGLEPVDRRLVDPQAAVALLERHRQVGAEVEELVLDPREPRVAGHDLRPPEQGVQLVDRRRRRARADRASRHATRRRARSRRRRPHACRSASAERARHVSARGLTRASVYLGSGSSL